MCMWIGHYFFWQATIYDEKQPAVVDINSTWIVSNPSSRMKYEGIGVILNLCMYLTSSEHRICANSEEEEDKKVA